MPKSGGNTFSSTVFGNYSGESLQADNLTDDLRARGLITRSTLKQNYDGGGGLGGPIAQDKLWFYTGHRWWGTQSTAPSSLANKTRGTPFYTPDSSRVGYIDTHQQDHSLRLTWQAAPKHKVTLFDSYQDNCFCHYFLNTSLRALEAAVDFPLRPINVAQATWSYAATNRLLFEAGATNYTDINTGLPQPGVLPTTIGITELSTGLIYNANPTASCGGGSYGKTIQSQSNTRFSMSYVTGSHAFKIGGSTLRGEASYPDYHNNDLALSYSFLRGVPNSLTQWASPGSAFEKVRLNLGLYAQDQWTFRKLTLNVGVRLDYLNGYVPAQTRPASRFVGMLNVPEIDDAPNWKDVVPRLGAAYDLFGDGKTALKASVGRYVNAHSAEIAAAVNPANALVVSASRTWTDLNGDFVPDCDLNNRSANGECGAISNRAFDTVVTNTRYGSDVLQGFGARDYIWQTSALIQQQLRPGMSLNASCFRYSYGNFTATNNLLVTPTDYSPYCVVAPVDSRLPGGGGNQICGLYDVNPLKFAQVNNLVTLASQQSEVTNAFDVGINARFGKGGLLSGGVSTARTVTDNCYQNSLPNFTAAGYVAGTPRTTAFCQVTPPWSAQTQLKISGVLPLPWDLQASGVYQNLPGVPILANLSYTNAQVAPSLGRDLSNCPVTTAACTATVNVGLLPTGALYEDRLSQVDARLTKNIRFGRSRLRGILDLYNLFNASTIVSRNNTFGPSWGRPTAILGGRLIKFAAQFDC